jgi:hypothetical protein
MKREITSIVKRVIILFYILVIQLVAFCSVEVFGQNANVPVKLKLAADKKGISEFYWHGIFGSRNLIDKNKRFGELELKYRNKIIQIKDYEPEIIKAENDNIEVLFRLPENLNLKEEFKFSEYCISPRNNFYL